MTRMHNPAHPGDVLREYLGDVTVSEAAVKLCVNSVTLSAQTVKSNSSFLDVKQLAQNSQKTDDLTEN